MRKTHILIVSLILLTNIVNAQIKFGFKEGVNLSTQSEPGMLWNNNDIKTGFTLGVVFDYRFHNKLSLQTEVNYKRTGLAYEKEETHSNLKIKRDYDYYNIPLFLKCRFNNELGLNQNWSVSFYGGPYYSYLLKANLEIEKNGQTTVSDYKSQSNLSDWGVIMGGEVARIFTNGELFADIRYEMGLTDVSKSENIKNKVIGIGIGYRF